MTAFSVFHVSYGFGKLIELILLFRHSVDEVAFATRPVFSTADVSSEFLVRVFVPQTDFFVSHKFKLIEFKSHTDHHVTNFRHVHSRKHQRSKHPSNKHSL